MQRRTLLASAAALSIPAAHAFRRADLKDVVEGQAVFWSIKRA